MRRSKVVGRVSGAMPQVCITLGAALLGVLLSGCGDSTSAGSGSTQGVTNSGTGGGSGATQSTNWSGYARTGALAGFKQVSGSWTVPQPDCSGGATASSATWAGIGGLKSGDLTLIQAGTEQDCNSGSPGYYAWWEGYPAASQDISGSGNYPVQAGDQITVTISSSLLLLWNISIHDNSAGWTFTTTTPFVAAGESAEWIEEAPLNISVGSSGGSRQATLANFCSVSFNALAANSANPALTASDSIDMVDAKGNVVASPSAPGAGGDSFDVCFGSGSCN